MTERSSTGTAELPPDLVEAVTTELLAHGEFSSGMNNRTNAREAARVVIDMVLSSRPAQGPLDRGVIEFEYCNWLGRKSLREARPISIRFGRSEWHPKPQWLMLAFDVHKGAEREFAMADMAFEDDALGALALTSTPSGPPPDWKQDQAETSRLPPKLESSR